MPKWATWPVPRATTRTRIVVFFRIFFGVCLVRTTTRRFVVLTFTVLRAFFGSTVTATEAAWSSPTVILRTNFVRPVRRIFFAFVRAATVNVVGGPPNATYTLWGR